MLMRATTILSLMLALTISSSGQTRSTNLKPGSLEAKALALFEQIKDRSFDDYLKRVRLPKVSAAFKAEVLVRIAKGEGVKVSDGLKGKLAALEPILRYHERDSVIEIRVIGVEEQLQAVVAHELGHEYFWGELMESRQQKERETMREIELRCDGIAVIALRRLRLDPGTLVSAITTIRMFNARAVSTDSHYHPLPDERSRFIRAMSELARQRDEALAQSPH